MVNFSKLLLYKRHKFEFTKCNFPFVNGDILPLRLEDKMNYLTFHKKCLSTLYSTHTVSLYIAQYTHSASLHCTVHTQYPSTLYSTHTVCLYTVQYTHSVPLHCAVHTQCLFTQYSTHTVPLYAVQ